MKIQLSGEVHIYLHESGVLGKDQEILMILTQINRRIGHMARQIDTLNEKVDGLTAVVGKLTDGVENIAAEIQALIAGGDGATPAELSALSVKVDAITAGVQAEVDRLTAIDPTPGSTPGGTPPPPPVA